MSRLPHQFARQSTYSLNQFEKLGNEKAEKAAEVTRAVSGDAQPQTVTPLRGALVSFSDRDGT